MHIHYKHMKNRKNSWVICGDLKPSELGPPESYNNEK